MSTPTAASPKTWCCSGARCPRPSVQSFSHVQRDEACLLAHSGPSPACSSATLYMYSINSCASSKKLHIGP